MGLNPKFFLQKKEVTMKKLLTLIVAGCLVLGSLGSAAAVDVKVTGQWQWHYGYYSHNSLMSASDTGSHEDRLRFRQRLRVQTRFIASETLSGMLNFEIGDLNWGNNSVGSSGGRQGGGLDADGYEIKVKWAFLDWTLPNTQIKTRMGIQEMAFPSVVAGNPVFSADVAGIAVSSQLTPELGLNFFWARPYDSGWSSENDNTSRNQWDEMDIFGIMLPIKTNVVRATPWIAGAIIGKDSMYYGTQRPTTRLDRIRNTGPSGWYVGGRWVDNSDMDSQGYGWWAGSTLELPILDPFLFQLDAMLGGLETGDSDFDAFGYWVATRIGYKFSWGTPAFIGWYSSGDKDKDDRGIIPSIAEVNGFTMTRYGMSGTSRRSFDDVIGTIGFGMWGAGFEVANVSFIDDVKHTLRFVYMGGTNDGKALHGEGAGNKASWASGDILVTSDHAWEINLLNDWRVNKNLAIALDLAYVKMELGNQRTNKDDTEGSFAAMINLQYSF